MTTYTKETALYDTGAIGDDIADAGTKASKFLSADGTGIMVYDGSAGQQYPSTVSSGTNNVFISDSAMSIRNGANVLSKFSSDEIVVGSSSNSTLSLDDDSITAYGENRKTFFNVAGDGAQINTWYNIDKVKVTQVSELVDGVEFIHSDSEFVDSIKIHVTTDVHVTTPGGSKILVAFPSSEFNYGTSSTDTHSHNSDGVNFNILITYTSPSTFEINFDSVSYVDSVDISISKLKNANAPIYDFGQDNGVTGAFSMVVGATNHSAGNYSFASGYNCFADGFASFANGSYSHANGSSSHADGYLVIADKAYSHASGDSTRAMMKAQTVIGTYNTVDTEPSIAVHTNGQTDYGNYAFIIGNGKNGARSNALTVDWAGNVNAAGDYITRQTTLNLGNYVGAAILSSNAGDLHFSIPTGRVFPSGTTISKITFYIVSRASNANGIGYYIIKSASGGSDGAAFDSSASKTFYNANNASKTITTSMWRKYLDGGTNIRIMFVGGNDFFSGTTTIRNYINNNATTVYVSNIVVTLDIPSA